MICTGGFQTASVIRAAIERGDCDAVSAARPLVANNDLVQMFERGLDTAPEPCTLLQQVPGQRRREPAGLLRRAAVPVARRDDRADHVGLQAGARGAGVTRQAIVRAVGRAAASPSRPLPFRSRSAAADVARARTTSSPTSSTARSALKGRSAFPIRIWRVLPVLFADKLPKRPGEGWEKLGFIFESGSPQNRPIGTSYVEDRVPLVGLNCATCHTGTVRESPTSPRQIIPGMPAHQMDLQGYANFLTAARQGSALRGRHADRGDPQAGSRVLVVHVAACIGSS